MEHWNDDREKKKARKEERESAWIALGVCRSTRVIGGQSFILRGLGQDRGSYTVQNAWLS